jgi:hypothetical protein
MHTICSPIGKILRMVIFRKNGVQAMVELVLNNNKGRLIEVQTKL